MSRSSLGIAEAPAMTLNRIYHWVPRIMSGLSQMSGSSRKATITETASGNRRFAGKAARNWAIGWAKRAAPGRSPSQTPAGTQMRLASAISTKTRAMVAKPSSTAVPTSPGATPASTKVAIFHPAPRQAAAIAADQR